MGSSHSKSLHGILRASMLTRKLQDSAEGTGCAFRSDLWQLLAEWVGEQPDGQQEVVLGAFVVVQVRSTEA